MKLMPSCDLARSSQFFSEIFAESISFPASLAGMGSEQYSFSAPVIATVVWAESFLFGRSGTLASSADFESSSLCAGSAQLLTTNIMNQSEWLIDSFPLLDSLRFGWSPRFPDSVSVGSGAFLVSISFHFTHRLGFKSTKIESSALFNDSSVQACTRDSISYIVFHASEVLKTAGGFRSAGPFASNAFLFSDSVNNSPLPPLSIAFGPTSVVALSFDFHESVRHTVSSVLFSFGFVLSSQFIDSMDMIQTHRHALSAIFAKSHDFDSSIVVKQTFISIHTHSVISDIYDVSGLFGVNLSLQESLAFFQSENILSFLEFAFSDLWEISSSLNASLRY
jgi:hypothetical protein